MRPDPSGQIAGYLATNRNFILADIYTFVSTYGDVLRYSGYGVPFVVPGTMFDAHSVNTGTPGTIGYPLGPRFGRSRVTTKVGLEVDTMALEIYAGVNDRVGIYTWQEAFVNGVFDLATVELGRLICQPQLGGGVGSIVGHIVWFKGIVGDAEIGRTAIKVNVNSTLALLSTQYPRRLWQHTCSHVFGDAMCQFDRQSMAVTVQAQAGSGGGTVVAGISPNPATLYNEGTIVGMSGANVNVRRTINDASTGTIYSTAPFVYPIAVGDYFYILPGCDHTYPTCQNVFNNFGHFGGMPWIPTSEFAI